MARLSRTAGCWRRCYRASKYVSVTRAQLDALAAQLARDYPESNLGTLDRPKEPRPFAVLPATRIMPQQRAQVAMSAAVLMGGVGLVLLLACVRIDPARALAGD